MTLTTSLPVTWWWFVEVPYWWNRGCFVIIFGNFFHARWKILFLHGGEQIWWDVAAVLWCTKDDFLPGGGGTWYGYPPTMTMAMQGENAHARWEMAMQGENVHTRWKMATWVEKWSDEVKMLMQGENGHARWVMATRATWWNSSLHDIHCCPLVQWKGLESQVV